ncbi:hypothetical protein PISMIDRAFT_689459, partial [Pisolithus microcarpus 441]
MASKSCAARMVAMTKLFQVPAWRTHARHMRRAGISPIYLELVRICCDTRQR